MIKEDIEGTIRRRWDPQFRTVNIGDHTLVAFYWNIIVVTDRTARVVASIKTRLCVHQRCSGCGLPSIAVDPYSRMHIDAVRY